jgi:hypothetical protein
MNFYYDTILGLQYDYIEPFFSIDLTVIPQKFDFDTEHWTEYLKNIDLRMVNENTTSLPGIEKVSFITDYKL